MEDNKKKTTTMTDNTIVIDDGSVEVTVRNKNGDEIGRFSFQPTDLGIIERFNKLATDFESITAPLEKLDIASDGTVDSEDEGQLSALHEAEKKLFAACDSLFQSPVSTAFFSKTHPFSPIGGRFFCETVLEALGKFVSAQFEREVKQINSRVGKYTKDYEPRTGKHRRGKK